MNSPAFTSSPPACCPGINGYLHPGYAASLAEFGEPLGLPDSHGWLIKRNIPGTNLFDARGCYPLFVCQNWPSLTGDLAGLAGKLVSVVMVTDPFGDYTEEMLRACFPDRFIRFKEHFVVDLEKPWQSEVSSSHKQKAKSALKLMNMEQVLEPSTAVADWVRLYDTLVQRHGIRGISAFSKASFTIQLSVPGLIAIRAWHQSEVVGMILWYVSGDTAYYHLAASSEKGYQLQASFALMWESFNRLAQTGVRWVGLGAGAGVNANQEDGLTTFKRRWATDRRQVYLCGRILDREKYVEVCAASGCEGSNYFPAYRGGAENT